MGLIKNVKLSSFTKEKTTRFDFKFIDYYESIDYDYYTWKELFEFIEYQKLDISKLQNFKYVEIGNISKNGDISPIDLSFKNRNDENENYFKKIEKGDIIKPKKGDILLSSIRPYLNKNILIEDEEYFFTKAMIQIRPKINNKLFYYLIRTIFFNLINAVSRQGKGYPTLKENDLKSIKFPKNIIDSLLVSEQVLLKQISPLENEIKVLKSTKQEYLEIINEVFANHFNIDLDEVEKLENIKQFNLAFRLSGLKNSSLRTSYKWHKLETIQSYIYKEIDCIEKLDKFITSMNNGWSPESSEVEEGTAILGQEHIQKNGTISLNASKFTTKTKNNIENFYIKQNDFFVSRGNTVELVALASVVTDEVEENILYPDLYIRVDFDDEFVNKQYMAFLFNSFIGRVYFKHVAKGKNQTMVKVSAKELYDFYVPLPSLDIQEEILKEVEVKIEAQQNVDKEIEEKQLEISELIENVIKENG